MRVVTTTLLAYAAGDVLCIGDYKESSCTAELLQVLVLGISCTTIRVCAQTRSLLSSSFEELKWIESLARAMYLLSHIHCTATHGHSNQVQRES